MPACPPLLRRVCIAAIPALFILGVACGGSGSDGGTGAGSPKLRLGYFPNLTHATAIIGIEQGIFEKALGGSQLKVAPLSSGPEVVEALFSGALDVAYIGPSPAINAFAKSKGKAIRIISGATSGGASLVVQPDVTVNNLRGKKFASPQLGNTQDVALRYWLSEHGLQSDPTGGGEASVLPQENAQTLETFRSGQIDGAWVPEPWATRLVQEGEGKVLVDERSLWPSGWFVTTHLIVRTEFLREHPDVVRKLLKGHVAANRFIHANQTEARSVVNQGIKKMTGKLLPREVIEVSWANLEFTNDPIAPSLVAAARHAEKVDLLEPVNLDGIYDLTLLNEILRQSGESEVLDS